MYGALWRILPGPVWLRLIFVLILIVAALWALVTWGFPWVESIVNNQEVTINPEG